MRNLKVAFGSSCRAVNWENRTMSYREICDILQDPVRTNETVEEYHSFSKQQRDSIKDRGGIVGGELRDNRRLSTNVVCRSMGALDIDTPDANFIDRLQETANYAWVLYSTHSHTPEAPRYRIFIPFGRDVTPEEYVAVMRYVAADIGMECVDPCSFRINQLMYWPTVASDGEYIFKEHDGREFDPDALLTEHPNWRDITTLPISPKEKAQHKAEARKQENPLEKRGVIGAFNNVFYPISVLLETELSDVYEPTAIEDRYTHIGSSTTAGAIVYDDRFLYSFHATDPASGQLCNAFDLMRIHRFGEMGDEESRKQAMAYAAGIPAVRAWIDRDKIAELQSDFGSDSLEHPTPAQPPLGGGKLHLPEPIVFADLKELPERPPALIHGILRRGHKMLVGGSSKAGKSFLLMQLAIAISEGLPWLHFNCVRGKVLYINLEIDGASCLKRFEDIYKAMGIKAQHKDNLHIWNLRGHAYPLSVLVPEIIEYLKKDTFSAVIIDPIYKVIMGDENSASDMGAFCNQFDKICTACNVSAIYCHHHSKGAQGGKRAIDRTSGSGVFGRDPDAILDMVELKIPLFKTSEEETEEGDTVQISAFDTNRKAFRMEFSLREFPPAPSINFFFDYPLHVLDTNGELNVLIPEGSSESAKEQRRKRSVNDRKRRLDRAFEKASRKGRATVKDMAKAVDVSEETIRRYLREFDESYDLKNGVVFENEPLK